MISNLRKTIFISNIIILSFGIAGCKQGEEDAQTHTIEITVPAGYIKQLMIHRNEQNDFFRGPQSPLEDSVKKFFAGISYFEPDTLFRVTADIEKVENGSVFKMQSTGSIADDYKLVAKLHFKLNGAEQQLEVYENQELKKSGVTYNFIPFNDLTNGKDTYGGGRYLDIEPIAGDKMIIDFNYAYQPYCAYNHNYSCPIPPAVNKMQVEIKAGEKLPAE